MPHGGAAVCKYTGKPLSDDWTAQTQRVRRARVGILKRIGSIVSSDNVGVVFAIRTPGGAVRTGRAYTRAISSKGRDVSDMPLRDLLSVTQMSDADVAKLTVSQILSLIVLHDNTTMMRRMYRSICDE